MVSAFQKVLVVDDGVRPCDRALSAELAELGYASVTASLDAADDVLASMPSPAAILLHLPRSGGSADRDPFLALAERFRKTRGAGVPILLLEHTGAGSGGFAAALEGQIGARLLNEPLL